MPFFLIHGTYRVLGTSPDGDSVRFYPDDPAMWDVLRARRSYPLRANREGGVQLRLDGIDALETHYSPRPFALGVLRQPFALGRAAADLLLRVLGFDGITRLPDETVTAVEPRETPGSIFTRHVDKYGRAVCFAFPGRLPGPSGGRVRVEPDDIAASANQALLEAGLAYPTFYTELFADLRDALTSSARRARAAGRGVWKEDVTQDGFAPSTLADLTERLVILPKLFRRLADYLAIAMAPYDDDLPFFIRDLTARADRVLVLDRREVTTLDTLVAFVEGQLRLVTSPENLVFYDD